MAQHTPEFETWIREALVDRVDEHNRDAIIDMHARNWTAISLAPGSSYNHHFWQGGYIEHIRQVNVFAHELFALWERMGIFDSLEPSEQFSLPDALTVTTIHDIEKPFMRTYDDTGSLRVSHEGGKTNKDAIKAAILDEYGLDLSPQQQYALDHVEGMIGTYSPRARVLSPMAALCHTADLLSARGGFNLGNTTDFYPVLEPVNIEQEVRNRDIRLATNGEVVGLYEREFYVFSNFSSFRVVWHGREWQTSEHAYQAAHFFDTAPELAEQIALAPSAHEAYKLAKANGHLARADWDEVKVEIMYEICKAKLEQHAYVMQKLRETKDLYIVEDSPKDSFWGWGEDRQGRNELGKIWMRLRSEL